MFTKNTVAVIMMVMFMAIFRDVLASPLVIPKDAILLDAPIVDQVFTLKGALKDEIYVEFISTTYKTTKKQAKKILANINELTAGYDFPKKEDVLSVIAIESSFNCKAESTSSIGCMQINRKAWRMERDYLLNVDNNIYEGIRILREYYLIMEGDKRKTLLAYNVGPTAFKKGEFNEKYWIKFQEAYKKFW